MAKCLFAIIQIVQKFHSTVLRRRVKEMESEDERVAEAKSGLCGDGVANNKESEERAA